MSENKISFNHFPGDFDTLLRNEILLPPTQKKNEGLIILLRGSAGTGKTTLALQLAFYLSCIQRDKKMPDPGIYYSLEQNTDTLINKLSEMLAYQVQYLCEMKEYDSSSYIKNIHEPIKKICVEIKKQITTLLNKITRIEAESYSNPERENSLKQKIGAIVLKQKTSISSVLSTPKKRNLMLENLQTNPRSEMSVLSITQDKALSLVCELLNKQATDKKNSAIVIDGLATLPSYQRKIIGIDRLIDMVKSNAEIGIIVYEPGEENEEEYLDHMADMVIKLGEHPVEGSMSYLINEMHILKSRYQNPARGWHQYKIRDWGLEFFPSIHFQVHRPNYMPITYSNSLDGIATFSKQQSKHKAKKEGKDSQINKKSIVGGLIGATDPGSVTVLLGSRGSFKSQLCLDFLAAGAVNGQHSLLISTIDNRENLNRDLICPRSLCKKCKKNNCQKYIHLFHQRPGCITPAEFLYYIKKRLNSDRINLIKRLVFWDLTQIDYRFPMFYDDKMFIPALMDTFKFEDNKNDKSDNRDLRSLIMGAGNAHYSKAVSAMADNVIFCWRDTIKFNSTLDKRSSGDTIMENYLGDLYEESKHSEIITAINGDSKSSKTKKGALFKEQKEALFVYVDRREKSSQTTNDNLYAFPVLNGHLKLPVFDWDPQTYAINLQKKNLLDFGLFLTARNILKIRQQQGLE